MTAGSACARMDVLIFCVLSAALAPPQMPSIQDKRYRRHWTEACLACWLIYAATMPRCPARGPADGDGSGGSAAGGGGNCRPGAVGGGGGGSGCSTVTEEQWEPHHPHPHGCLCTMYQNATCRIPSVLHSLTVCLPNNRVVWLAGTGQGNSGSLQNKSPALFMTSTQNFQILKLCCSFNLSFFFRFFNFRKCLIFSNIL